MTKMVLMVETKEIMKEIDTDEKRKRCSSLMCEKEAVIFIKEHGWFCSEHGEAYSKQQKINKEKKLLEGKEFKLVALKDVIGEYKKEIKILKKSNSKLLKRCATLSMKLIVIRKAVRG